MMTLREFTVPLLLAIHIHLINIRSEAVNIWTTVISLLTLLIGLSQMSRFSMFTFLLLLFGFEAAHALTPVPNCLPSWEWVRLSNLRRRLSMADSLFRHTTLLPKIRVKSYNT
jgi:hypothetical protein